MLNYFEIDCDYYFHQFWMTAEFLISPSAWYKIYQELLRKLVDYNLFGRKIEV